MTYTLSTQFVARVAGQPSSQLTTICAPGWTYQLQDLQRARSALGQQQKKVEQHLYERIATANVEVRASLINLRRDIHNGRLGQVRKVLDMNSLDHDTRSLIEALLQTAEHAEAAVRTVEESYAIALKAGQEALLDLANDEDFRKGLLLSSRALHDVVIRDPLSKSRSKREQIVRGLLRYATRSITKTTPFGAFCTVIAGKVAENASKSSQSFDLVGDLTKESFVRINRSLLPAMWDKLSSHHLVRRHLPVALNPSVRIVEGHVEWIVEREGIESYRRTAVTRTNLYVLDACRTRPGISLSELHGLLLEAAGGTSPEQSGDRAWQFLDSLLSAGILIFDHQVSVSDPAWDLKVRDLLSGIDVPEAQRIVSTLGRVRARIDGFVRENSVQRAVTLDELATDVQEAAEALGGPLRATNGLVLYEDCGAKAEVVMNPNLMDAGRQRTVAALLDVLIRLSAQNDQMETMHAVFMQCYGAETRQVPLIQFYEDSFRVHYKDHFRFEKNPELAMRENYDHLNPLGLRSIAQRAAVRRRLIEIIAAKIQASPTDQTAQICLNELDEALQLAEPQVLPPSFAMFVQFQSDGRDHANDLMVWPEARAYVGMGKYYSRFLHALPDGFLDQTRAEANAELRVRFAELSDDANFNPNLHPPILRGVIAYPTRPITTEASQVYQCTDLVVETDGERALRLIHRPTGDTIVPVDLGFLNPQMRPALYRLLTVFQPFGVAALPIEPVITAVTVQKSKLSEDVRVDGEPDIGTRWRAIRTPRVCVNDFVVVARARWTIAVEDVPKPSPTHSLASYLLLLQRWRDYIGLPERVFVQYRPNQRHTKTSDQVSTKTRSQPRKRGSSDLYKPQYVDFRSPVLIDYFIKTYTELPQGALLFEEVLPHPSNGIESESGQHAMECVLHFNTTDRADAKGTVNTP